MSVFLTHGVINQRDDVIIFPQKFDILTNFWPQWKEYFWNSFFACDLNLVFNDITLHANAFYKSDNLMYFFQFKANLILIFWCALHTSVFLKIWYKFFHFSDFQSLWQKWQVAMLFGSSFGHSISNFKIYPCPSFFTSLFIFIRFIRLSIFKGSLTLNMENMCSFHQDCIALLNNYYWFLHRI